MPPFLIREAKIEDVDQLKDCLRDADARELIASGYESVEQALLRSFARSTLRYSVELENGKDWSVVAMFGLVPDTIIGHRANVWFLGAGGMSKIKKSFVKSSRVVISEFLKRYPELWNLVDERYASSIAWLKSCGAEFGDKAIQQGGVNFYPFIIRRA